MFVQIRQFCSGLGECEASYPDAAQRLGRRVGTVRNDVRRMRKRFRKIVREEVAAAVAPGTADDEMRRIVDILCR